MALIKIGVLLGLGFISGLLIPEVSEEIIAYKLKKKGREVPEPLKLNKLLLAVPNALLFALAAWLMPLPEALITCIFGYIALVAAVIDYRIRIICNEMVLLIFVLGIVYRVINGGVGSLLGSLGAFAIVLVVFGGAAVITRLIANDIGVGAGDIKLAMAIAVTVGFGGIFYFLGGIALAIGAYSIIGLNMHLLTTKSTFPMCAHIMFGFLAALFVPYIL